jgi:hypothetical protein
LDAESVTAKFDAEAINEIEREKEGIETECETKNEFGPPPLFFARM